jgi:flagellar FliL protein
MAKVALVEAAPPEDELDAPKKKGGKGKIIILAVAVLVLAGGGFAGWKMFAGGHAADEHAAEKAAADTPPVFLPVDQFTVNLNPEGGEQFLQTAFSLKVTDQEVVDALKARAPELRNQVLLLLSSKKASELTSVEGKQKLAAQLVAVANQTITPAFPALKKAADAKAAAEAKAAADAKAAAEAKAAKEAKAADAGAADKTEKTDKESDAEDKPAEPKKEGKAAKKDKDGESGKAAAPAHAVLDVLFTHFIIQ